MRMSSLAVASSRLPSRYGIGCAGSRRRIPGAGTAAGRFGSALRRTGGSVRTTHGSRPHMVQAVETGTESLQNDGSRKRPRTSWSTEPPAADVPVSSDGIIFRWPPDVSNITPVKAAVWSGLAMAAVAATAAVVRAVVLNPTLWMYASWFLVVWPQPVAMALGLATAVIAARRAQTRAREWEQVLMLGGSMVWLILVPLGSVHGYVDGWPLVLFATYFLFFLINSVVRIRLYGDLSPGSEDRQWASTPSRLAQAGFIMSVVAGHWVAALEAQPLLLSWNLGWTSKLAAALLLLAFVAHWNATYFLGKYSDRLVRPRAVVMFGPYRWVRHPIYGSYMLLFAGYCVALRSYWSLLFLFAACFLYYEQRTKVEEHKLVESFGNLYTSYRDRVKKRYLPFLV